MPLTLAFLIGAIVGSFLNVCIVRLPNDESIVLPGSHCRHCKAPLRIVDNIPLLSFLWLGGRCHACGEAVSRRYPLVELITALLFVVVAANSPPNLLMLVRAGFVSALIVITFIDLEHQIIPDIISLPGILIGLALAAVGWGPPFFDSLIGTLVGGGFFYLVATGFHAATGVEGLGGGDIKLLAMIGSFLGWQATLLTILISSFAGSIFGAAILLIQRSDSRVPIPFGPYLALGAIISLLYGDSLLQWYMSRVLFL